MIAILDNLRSAQNVGSILRTCDAFGVKDVYLCGITPDQNNKKVVKTSLGAEKNINIKSFPSTRLAVMEARKNKYSIVAIETGKESKKLKDIKINKKLALVIGNEVSGVSEEIINSADITVEIPMKGVKESLNVAVAFAIVAYEVTRH